MKKEDIIAAITEFVATSDGNHVKAEDAMFPQLAGMRFYEEPLVGFASAFDPLYTESFKKPEVIHPEHMTPLEWMPEAKTVISFFVPFTKEVKDSNKKWADESYDESVKLLCSAEWLHARIEGQEFLCKITDHIQAVLEAEGYKTVCPATSGKPLMVTPLIPRWSERHTAFAAGLGTFGLSKGLITKKGMAGRFGSVITDAVFEPTVREYTSPFEYCTMCGACVCRCPVGAIDASKGVAHGKDHNICSKYLYSGMTPPHGPRGVQRYGCGKCQVSVPCENGIPKRING